ncbi:MAG: hypothetical protein MK085_09990, partial [Phycisphaerales bacterium]|nr:hypothetical protein [Phycisphaerales bacterium]
ARYVQTARPVDPAGMHRQLKAWAEDEGRRFPAKGPIDPNDLQLTESLLTWLADPDRGVHARQADGRIQVRKGNRNTPPTVFLNPMDGMSWTITWERLPTKSMPLEKSSGEGAAVEEQELPEATYVPRVKWAFSRTD